MNISGVTEQPVSSCSGWKLVQAQDLIAEIAESQRYLSIAHTLIRESLVELDPDLEVLFYAYLGSGVTEKLQSVSDLIEAARKTTA